MKRILIQLLKGLGAIVGTVIALVLFLLGAFLFKPDWLVNNATLHLAQRLLNKSGIHLTWGNAQLTASSVTRLTKVIELTTDGLCVKVPPTVDFCSQRAFVSVTVSFRQIIPRVHIVGPLEVVAGRLKLEIPESKEAPSTDEASFSFHLEDFIPRWLARADLRPVAIDLADYHMQFGATSVKGVARVGVVPRPPGSNFYLVHHTVVSSPGNRIADVSGNIRLSSLKTAWEGPYVVRLDEKGKVLGDSDVKLTLDVTDDHGSHLPFNLQATFGQGKKLAIDAQVKGTYGFDGSVKGQFDVVAKRLADALPRLQMKACQLAVTPLPKSKKKKSLAQSHVQLNCPIAVSPTLPSLAKGLPPNILSPLDVLLTTDLTMPFPPDSASPVAGKIGLSLDPLRTAVFQGAGGAEVAVKGNLANFPNSLNAKTTIQASVKIPEFRALVHEMGRSKSWGIPEPLNSLTGEIALQVGGEGDLPWHVRLFPLKLTTRLASRSQKLNIDTDGSFALEDRPVSPGSSETLLHSTLTSQINLSEIRLVLPHLNLSAPPQLIPDPRIRIKADGTRELAGEGPPTFHYDIKIATPANQPLRLSSNLAKADIPIDINVHLLEGKPPELHLKVARFPIDLFRRQADLEHFIVRSAPNSDKLLLDGRIQISYTDYRILIAISGNSDSPKIDFSSEPPLSDTQLIAVLFFGRPLEQLEPGQMESVGSAQAAITDGAVSLASMYLLASTPIESVGYDSTSGVVTAKVRLADGTSLNVGSDFRQINSLGIRKRLGPNWAITTYLDNPFDTLTRTLNAFLEWNRRY
jgi:hypothetical protein